MKTLDEVINKLECYPVSPSTLPCSVSIVTVEDLDDALHYLRQYQKDKQIYSYDIARRNLEVAERNDPLSWDELKQMKGKPVWTVESTVTYDDNGIERIGHWNIIKEVTQEHIIFYIGLPYHKSWQGIGWQAYRKERE